MPDETDENEWITMSTRQARDHVHDWIDEIEETDRIANLIQSICGFRKVAVIEDGKAISIHDANSEWKTLPVDDARNFLLKCIKNIKDPKHIAQLLQDVCGCRKVAVLPGGKEIAFQIE